MTYLTGTAPYTNLAGQVLAQVALSSTTSGLQTLAMSDLLGRQMIQGAAAVNSSSYGLYPVFVGGVNQLGLIAPLQITADGLKCDTELTLEASSVTVGNVKTWANSAGTQYFGLCDSSQRPILSNTSTVQAILYTNASTAGLVIAGGTIGVETEFATGSTFSIYPFTTSTVGVSIPTTSTLGAAVSWAATSTLDVRFADTSTVQISGALSTTSTVPVSFATTSTLGAVVSWATGSTMDVSFAPTSTVQVSGALSTTSTVPVSFAATSTIGVSWAQDTTSTVPISFATTSTLGAAVSWATGSTMDVSFATTSTIQSVSAAVTASVTGASTAPLNVTTTAATIPANAARQYLLLRNLNSNVVLLKHNATASTTSYDMFLRQNDGLEYNQNNLWTGYISYMTSTLTSTMTTLEW